MRSVNMVTMNHAVMYETHWMGQWKILLSETDSYCSKDGAAFATSTTVLLNNVQSSRLWTF